MRSLSLTAALTALLTACAGVTPRSPQDYLQAGLTAPAPRDFSPAHITALPVPAGVDVAVWHRLTSALAASVPADVVRRASSATAELPRPSEVTFDPATHELSWAYELAGDYNQDGEVTLADLVPLAQRFGEHDYGHPGSNGQGFPYWSIQAVIDGDRNGEIGLSDLTVLGRHLGTQVASYSMYASVNCADYPLAELKQTYPRLRDPDGGFKMPADFLWYEIRYMTPSEPPLHGPLWQVTIPANLAAFTAADRTAGRLKLHNADPGYNSLWQMLWLRAEGHGLSGGPSLPAMRPLPATPFAAPADWGLQYDSSSQVLSWYYFYCGDGDTNFFVGMEDLIDIVEHWLELGPWQISDNNYSRDCLRANLITLRGMRVIGKFYTTDWNRYEIRGTDDPTQLPPTGGGSVLLTFDHDNYSIANLPDVRKRFISDMSAFSEKYVWVVPYSSDRFGITTAGPPSDVITRF